MRTRTTAAVAVAAVAVAVGAGIAFVALSGDEEERRAAALTSSDEFTRYYGWRLAVDDVGIAVEKVNCGYVAATPPADRFSKPGPPKYSACTFTVGAQAGPAMWAWVNAHLTPGASPVRKIRFVAFDRTGAPASTISLSGAWISKLTLPRLAADELDREIELDVTVNAAEVTTAPGGTAPAPPAPPGGKQIVLTNAFELAIDGLNTQDVTEIAPLGFEYDMQTGPKLANVTYSIVEHPTNVLGVDKLLRETAVSGVQSKPKNAKVTLKAAGQPVLSLNLTGVTIVGGSLHGLTGSAESGQVARRTFDFAAAGAQLAGS